MGDVENFTNAPILGKTMQDISDRNSTALVIPKEFVRELQIENPVSIAVLRDFNGRKHLLISKHYGEILLD